MTDLIADPATATFDVHNPATGSVIATLPEHDQSAVHQLASLGRAAQPRWESSGFAGRAKVMLRARKWLLRNAERVITTITQETGKTWEDAQLAEVLYAAQAFGFWAGHAERFLADERVRSTSPLMLGRKVVVSNRPMGLVGVIGPWNFPLVNSFGDCIPALMAGNAVILKPSEIAPLTSLLIERALLDCGMPPHVFQVATGGADTAQALIDEVDMVMFTGSTRTGRSVLKRAADRLIPVSLELGGKDPMIVLSDANLERAANRATYAGMQNAGQACLSIERVYVEETVYDEFVAKLCNKVAALRNGDPSAGPGTVDVGAVTSPRQLETIEAPVEAARAKGARVLVGGQRGSSPNGWFYQPTVLVDVDHTMAVMTEETFGPILPVMKVLDAQQAVELANDSGYGLGASIYTEDRRRGEQLARQLDVGSVAVNDAQLFYFAFGAPIGGHKQSGIGSRHGVDGIKKFTAQQTILVSPFGPDREPYMYPNRARITKILLVLVRAVWGRGGA